MEHPNDRLAALLEFKLKEYNRSSFIKDDPIVIPHSYSRRQDIEITAFWIAILSWGQRSTIIKKGRELFAMMGDSPYDFIVNHREKDRERLLGFIHRTFQPTDTLYFLDFLQRMYREYDSLEHVFFPEGISTTVKEALIRFHRFFFDHPLAPLRTKKHIATAEKNSSCKRLNMFLRWMIRRDKSGVDFGIWSSIDASQLMIPLDVHVYRVAHRLSLLKRKQSDWKAVEELTATLRLYDSADPVKYDYSLFIMGVE